MPRRKTAATDSTPAKIPITPTPVAGSLKPGEWLAIGCVLNIEECLAIRDSYQFAERNMPIVNVDTWDHPLLQREGEVTFIG
jgi:hypothetical protein